MLFKGIDLKAVSDEEVLFFIRIRGKASYFNEVYSQSFLSQFDGVKEFRCISEYPKDADVHIDLNSVERDFLSQEEQLRFDTLINILDVIRRCRALREISFVRSKKLIYRCYIFFSRFFEKNKNVKLIVMGTIDNYVMDVMERVGSNYGVVFLAVTGSFLSPQYNLISVRGEKNDYRAPSEEEVDSVFEKISNTKLSPMAPNKKRALKAAAYDYSSYLFRYAIRYLFKYKILGRLEYEYQFAPLFKKFCSLDQILATRRLRLESDIPERSNKKIAYIPLHYYPEATTDYWINDSFHVDYLTSVVDTIHKLRDYGFLVVVKEHPAFYLARFSKFYERIVEAGATLLTPFISTKQVFSIVDLIVVWNGSTGIEAIVHGKPIVKVTNSYYGDEIIRDLDSAGDFPVVSTEEGKEVVRKVLESSHRVV